MKDIDVSCCDEPYIVAHFDTFICRNCCVIMNNINYYNTTGISSSIMTNGEECFFNNVCNGEEENKYMIKYNSLINLLKEKNNKSNEKLNNNILIDTVKKYIEYTEKKILRANNKMESLSYVLYLTCLEFKEPKTLTFITNYMELLKGGFSRGIKEINIIRKNMQQEENYINNNKTKTNTLLQSYTKMILKFNNNKTIDYDEIFINKICTKLFNFINKLLVFNHSGITTKVIGCIYYVFLHLKYDINLMFFKQNNIEKNTIIKYVNSIQNSIYSTYCKELLIDCYVKSM